MPGTGFYADGTGTGNMRLNFSFVEPERIRRGIELLSEVIRERIAVDKTASATAGAGGSIVYGLSFANTGPVATGTTAIDLPRRLAPMTLEFVYTALLVVMLAASGVFGLYVIYRLLRG